jgi:hypothetical protein
MSLLFSSNFGLTVVLLLQISKEMFDFFEALGKIAEDGGSCAGPEGVHFPLRHSPT